MEEIILFLYIIGGVGWYGMFDVMNVKKHLMLFTILWPIFVPICILLTVLLKAKEKEKENE